MADVTFFDTNQLLTYEQAAKLLSVSVRTLRRWKSQGIIPYVILGVSDIRFRTASLDQWIKEREVS